MPFADVLQISSDVRQARNLLEKPAHYDEPSLVAPRALERLLA